MSLQMVLLLVLCVVGGRVRWDYYFLFKDERRRQGKVASVDLGKGKDVTSRQAGSCYNIMTFSTTSGTQPSLAQGKYLEEEGE